MGATGAKEGNSLRSLSLQGFICFSALVLRKFNMSLEILMERLMASGLDAQVDRRQLPLAVFGLMGAENSLLELDAQQLSIVNFKVELNEVVIPRFLANQNRILKVIPKAENIVGVLKNSFLLLKFAQDKFDVPWYCGFLQWGCESTFSQDSTSFGRDRKVWGAMQRTRELYPDDQVQEALAGYEFVKRLGQWEHPSDPGEIFWGFSKLDKDARATVNADRKTRIWAIIDAVGRYSEDGPQRQGAVEMLNGIFG